MEQHNRFEVVGLVGSGAQSIVYKVFDHKTGCFHAYKKYKQHPTMREAFLREKTWLQHNRLPGIPCLIDLIEDEVELGIILEWIEGESLIEWIQGKSKEAINRIVYQYLIRIIAIFESCISRTIPPFHFVDLKPEHVIVDVTGLVHFIDFGLCSISEDEIRIGVGHPLFTDPVSMCTGKHTFQSDLYAIAKVAIYALNSENTDNYNNYKSRWMLGLPSSLVRLLLKMSADILTYRYASIDAFFEDWNQKNIA